MPNQNVFPAIRYHNPDRALEWLTEVFGFEDYARAKAAGAEITRELTDQPYGSREYGVRDLEGNAWAFGTDNPHDA